MFLIVGLGNPGRQYAKTRHNVGWMVLDYLTKKEKWNSSKGANALYFKKGLNGQEVELLKPQTFMNNSGISVAYAVNKHKISSAHIVIVHDDKDIPFGEIKIQNNRGAAGHNGVASIIKHLGTQDFIRVRIGIQNLTTEKKTAADIVLKKFTKAEEKQLQQVIIKTAQALETIIGDGLSKAMTIYNQSV